jgi:hypothetical protein
MLVVGELQPLMDSSPSQDENPAISAFSRVLYTTKPNTSISTNKPEKQI